MPTPTAAMTASRTMAVGMNLENIVDWSPAWTFIDLFQASRPWISQVFNSQTWATSWDESTAPLLAVDADGTVRSLASWSVDGVEMRQHAGTLMFRSIGGAYPAGRYRAEWDGSGTVAFGFDAVVTATGVTPGGRPFADLQVTPSDAGIHLRIEATDPADPVRSINLWMPDHNGRSFVGQRWQPGAPFSPFHPLFLERLSPFRTLRFMGMQETNSSDLISWSQRRTATAVRAGSGPGGTPSEPLVNGMSLELMVQLANDLDADPWFNMPHQADDDFVRQFATYVLQNLEPGRKVYVEWANEAWNFAYGFEASRWVADRALAAGLDPALGQWIVAGQEARRDFDIWSQVFAGQADRQLVRVAAGWAANDWVTNAIAGSMDGAFDAIAIAPYLTPTDAQRASYSALTSVDQVLADTRSNILQSVQWVASHRQLADAWAASLGRPIQLLAYEGGPHLDGRNAPYQPAFHGATNDPRMGDIQRDYLRELAAAGLDLHMDFQFTGAAGATPWGDFGRLHRMDEPLATAFTYSAVREAADGTLWLPRLTLTGPAMPVVEGQGGVQTPVVFSVSRSPADATAGASVSWTVGGHGQNQALPADFVGGTYPTGSVALAPGQSSASFTVWVRGDRGQEPTEGFRVTLHGASGASLAGSWAASSVLNDDLTGTSAANGLSGGARSEFIDGRGGRDTLTGGGGTDQFGFRHGESSLLAPDRIRDLAIGSERLLLLAASGSPLAAPSALSRATDNGSATSLDQLSRAVFADANGAIAGSQPLAARQAALVVALQPAIAGTYLLVNDSSQIRNTAADLMVNISGFSGPLPHLGHSPVMNLFSVI